MFRSRDPVQNTHRLAAPARARVLLVPHLVREPRRRGRQQERAIGFYAQGCWLLLCLKYFQNLAILSLISNSFFVMEMNHSITNSQPLGVELPAVLVLTQSLMSKIAGVASLARKAPINQDTFIQLACYLERISPICNELQRGRDSSSMIGEILEALNRDVESANHLIEQCTNKSRLYHITHCRSIAQQIESVIHDIGRSLGLIPLSSVQYQEDTKAVIDSLSRDMQRAHFEASESDDRIFQLLNDESMRLEKDMDLQAGLLLEIARTVGIEDASHNTSELKTQLELLKNDLQGTTEIYDLQMMDMLGNMVENWTQNTDSVSLSDDMHGHEQKRIEPLYESFICPLTKTIMRDPVTLENGQTFERVAIETWFRKCKENGRPPLCPVTGKELERTTLKPSIALRHTIEEWTARNEMARIENCKMFLGSKSSQQDMLHGLKDVQLLCMKNKLNKHRVKTIGLIPFIVDCLKHGGQVCCTGLATLRILAEDDDENKVAIGETDGIRSCVKCLSRDNLHEREEAALLLFELSKSYALCEKIGSVSGAILMLVGTVSSKSDSVVTVEKAEQTLQNLESCDQNMRQMAENGRLQPLLKRLVEGNDEIQLEMATFLSDVVLSREGKIKAAEIGGKTLVKMLESGYLAGREAALKSLCQLSSLDTNGPVLIKAGILHPLIRDLFAVGVNQLPTKLKETSATALANVCNSGVTLDTVAVDSAGNTMISEVVLHNFLHLISNTGPAIGGKLLQVLMGLTSSPRAVEKLVGAIKSAGAEISLIQFLEASQRELRSNAVKLLCCLCKHMGQELADSLRITTGQLGTLVKLLGARGVTEEQAAAAQLLANLPVEDEQLSRALLAEGALPIVVRQLDELRQGIARIGGGRFLVTYKEGLVGILTRFTWMLDDATVENVAKEFNLTILFTNLLSSGGQDEIQRLSALALANLSIQTRHLSVVPDIEMKNSCCVCLNKASPKLEGVCVLHGGHCSAQETFCLLQAEAVVPLVACLEHRNVAVVEAALKALLTLLQDSGNCGAGVQVLSNADAIQPILDIMCEHKTEQLRQLAVAAVECMLRNLDIARTVATDSVVNTSLVEAYKYGNNVTRQTAEKALKHLNKIPTFSGVFYKSN